MENESQQPAEAGNADSGTGALDLNQATAVFDNLLGNTPEEKVETRAEDEPQGESEEVEAEAEDTPAPEVRMFTVKDSNGNDVQIPESELINGYKAQKSSTEKFEAAAALKRQAESEAAAAQRDRQQYAEGLNQARQLLNATLEEQTKSVDFDYLLQNDPQEYLKQKHLWERRQAALQDTNAKLAQLNHQDRATRINLLHAKLGEEREALLQKVPEWKDTAKAQAEKREIAQEMIDRGFDPLIVLGQPFKDGTLNPDAPGILEHKLILLARDAMRYRKMIDKAQAAAHKVGNLPKRVEQPGKSEINASDGRTTAMKRLQASGSLKDAAKVFEGLF